MKLGRGDFGCVSLLGRRLHCDARNQRAPHIGSVMTRLGFVGVGRHAQNMAAAFRECGAEVVAYDRSQSEESSVASAAERMVKFGSRVPWANMITSRVIDALIICAPPDVTTEVARACAKADMRCMATKPLMWRAPPIWPQMGTVPYLPSSFDFDSGVYVDLWRLYSPAWLALKADLRGKKIESLHVDFYGNGPVRGFSGLLDYGPHALAFVVDLLGEIPEMTWDDACGRHRGTGEFVDANSATPSLPLVSVATGNGAAGTSKLVEVVADGTCYQWVEHESDHGLFVQEGQLMACQAKLALRAFCRAFLAGESSDTLRISCEAMRVLMPMVAT